MIWLVGDSIFRGLALGRFPDVFTAEEAAAEPLWALRSPAPMMELICGEPVAAPMSITGLPDDRIIDRGILARSRKIEDGTIAPDDWIAFLDVGAHASDPDRHEQQWTRMLAALEGRHDRVIVCEGFDNFNGPVKPQYQHACLFGGRSHNDAVRAAAAGRARFIELHEPLQRLAAALAPYGCSPYRPDRIHLNIWGQLFVSVQILRAADLAPVRARTLRQFVRERWRTLAPAGGAQWSRRIADEVTRLAFDQKHALNQAAGAGEPGADVGKAKVPA